MSIAFGTPSPNAPHSPWTDERIDLLRRRWADGATASAIAAEIGGGIGRNAVIGKVHRLGLSGASKTYLTGGHKKAALKEIAKHAPRQRRRTASSAFPFAIGGQAPPFCDDGAATELPPDQSPFAVTLANLKEGQCKFPLGTPGTDAFRYCGAAICCRAYCARHARLCYRPIRRPTRAETELAFRRTARRGRIGADSLVNTNQEIA